MEVTVYNLATLLADLGRLDEAEAFYARALGTFERALGDGHPHTGICREGLEMLRGGGQPS